MNKKYGSGIFSKVRGTTLVSGVVSFEHLCFEHYGFAIFWIGMFVVLLSKEITLIMRG